MKRNYVFKTLAEAKKVRPEAMSYFRVIKGISKGYIGCYYSHSQVLEDVETGFISRGKSL